MHQVMQRDRINRAEEMDDFSEAANTRDMPDCLHRLQLVVVLLLEKNEQMRQQLSAYSREEMS